MPFKQKEIRISQVGGSIPASCLFFGLDPIQTKKLEKICKTKILPMGECLFSVGSIPDFICVLRKGAAELLTKAKGGNLRAVRSVAPNEICGLTESIANSPHETGLRAVTESEFTLVYRKELIDFLKEEPGICFECLTAVAESLIKSIRAANIRQFD